MPDLHIDYDYSFLHGPPPEDITRLLGEIRRLQRRLRGYRQNYPSIYEALVSASRVQALVWGCGGRGLERRAAEIAGRTSPPINIVEKEMAGYRDALFALELGTPQVSLTSRDLLGLHESLLSRSQPGQAGRYRETAYPGCPVPENIHLHIERWEQACKAALEDKFLPGLLLAPCAVRDFLHIMPFSPGNRRMAHLVARLLLKQAGVELPTAWEEQVGRYRFFYEQALGQEGYWPFATCFLVLVYLGCRQAERAFVVGPGQKVTKKNRIETAVLESPIPISKAELCRRLPDVSATTIEAALGTLVKSGQAIRIGPARTARYKAAP